MANSGADTNKSESPLPLICQSLKADFLVQPFDRSQFFITYSKQSHLDSKYTIFGKVIDGADSTLDAMERVPVDGKNRPKEEIKTLEVIVHANPIAAQ